MLRRHQRPADIQADTAFNSCVPTLCFAVGQGILTPLQLSHRASNTSRRWYDCHGWVSRWQPPLELGKQGLKAMVVGWNWPTFPEPRWNGRHR